MIRNSQSGFTLIELAVILVIVGLIVGASMAMMKPYVDYAQRNGTQEKLKNISTALATFVQNYGRLPCPASNTPTVEPFGSPISSGATGTNFIETECGARTLPNDYIGIVPYRALGLTEDNVRDSYGNLITYAVAPVLAEPVAASTRDVHSTCRTDIWVNPITGNTNLDKRKARFCCPYYRSATADIRVLDGLGSASSVYGGLHESNATEYVPVDGIPVTTTNTDSKLVAFVLVSHGPNGDRAYTNTGGRRPVTAAAGSQESENHNDDLTFVDRQLSLADGIDYFDDLVLWRANDQLVSLFGNDSCGRP